jgi:1-aminocyclopropane-1-carboxylate deaminase
MQDYKKILSNLLVKREDLNHPQLSGNKWHKLKYNVIEAKKRGYDKILTFGGAYSNHIYAVAAAGEIFEFDTIGIIRGEEHLPLNPTLMFAESKGMNIHYMDRNSYREKNSPENLKKLKKTFGKFYLIPEGGTNKLAVKGASEIISGTNESFDYICCACGTGGTLAGLITGLNGNKNALGFSVLKGGNFLIQEVERLVYETTGKKYNNWNINPDYHFGGYAKIDLNLIGFVERFQKINDILVEPIYTGKLLYGIYDFIFKGFFKKGQTILVIHTGGLQGLEGMNNRIEKLKTKLS